MAWLNVAIVADAGNWVRAWYLTRRDMWELHAVAPPIIMFAEHVNSTARACKQMQNPASTQLSSEFQRPIHSVLGTP